MSFSDRIGSLRDVKEDQGSQKRDEGGGGEKDLSNGGYIQRCVIIQRDDKGYGLTVRGDNPVYVESVKADGAAARAGVQQGDRIVKVNGTLVTNSNHIDVVKLIKSGSFVALTLLNKPPTGGGPDPSPGGSTRRVTAILPVDANKSKELVDSKYRELKRYYDLAFEDLQQSRKEYNKTPSAKLGAQITDKEKTVKKLEEQLKVLSPSVSFDTHGHHTESVPDLAQFDQQQTTTPSWLPSGPIHVKHGSTPAISNKKPNAGVTRSMSDAGTRRNKLQLPRHHYSIKSADTTPEPVTIIDGGSTSESPTVSPSSSPTPIHHRNLTAQSEDNDSVSSGTTKDSGYEESNTGSIGRAQQDIIAMEDDEFSDDDPSATGNNGAFSHISLLENRPSHLAVFLNYIITMNQDPSSLLFYIVSGYYQSAAGTCKELKKWAFEIYSTFLVAAGSPLKVNVDESISADIDFMIANKNDKEEVLRNVFSNARLSVQTELQNMLQDFCAKKDLGFSSMFGAHELKETMKKSVEIQIVEKYILSHLDRCLKDNTEEAVKSERDLAMGWALNTFLRNVGVTKHNSSMDRAQSFIAKDKRLLKIGQQKKKSVFNHQFQLQHYTKVEKCLHCDRVIWGVGYQGYLCQTCDLSVHKSCIDDLDDRDLCKKKRVKSKIGFGRPTSAAYPPLKEPDKDSLSPSPNQNAIFNIEPSKDEESGDHSVNRLVKNFEDLQGDKRKSPGLEPTEPHKYVVGKNQRRKKGSDLGRSESMKSRGDSKGDRPARRAKSDVDMDENLTRVLNSGSSSTSSLKSESPSTSVEAVNNIPQSVDNDSDFEVEAELPPLKEVLSEDVYRKLKPKERKRQEVINELFYTEKTHVKNLKILEMLFYKPMLSDSANEHLTRALFPNIEDILSLHTSLNDEMKKKRKENAVVGEVAEILVKRFDGEEGEAFRNGCAIYCRNQSHALDTLRLRQKKDSKLTNFLTLAESSNLMRRLQLKDLIPTQMMRLTKYPLLIESLMKYTSANSEEHAKLERALQCSKHILEYVNQAVKDYENHYKLEHLQRKIEKKIDGVANQEDVRQIKELDLPKHKLVYDGVLTWNINQRKTVDVHVVLLEDVLVLLQKQDDKLVLKFQSLQLVQGKDDSRYMFSPLLDLSSVLAANSKATDKKAFFVVAKSQIYELSAHTGEEQKKWIKLIKDSAETHKRNVTVGPNQLRPSGASPSRIEADKIPTPIFDSSMLDRADETQEPPLEQPDKIVISSPITSVAEPVLTPLERARRLDESIKETLEEKRRLVAEVISDVEARDREQQIPVSPETEALHNTIQEAMEECSSFITELCDRESGLMQENIQMPIPMDKLKEMANRMNQILTNLLEKTRAYHALTSGQNTSAAVVGSRDEERERLRRELKAAQDELNMLREFQRKVSSTSPPDMAKRERPQSLVSETSTLSSEDGTTQQQEAEGESDSNEDVQNEVIEDESTELIEPEVAIATEIPPCIDTSDLQEIEPSDEETIEDLDPPQIPENDLIQEAEVLHIPNMVTESEIVSEEVQDLDSLTEDSKQEVDSGNIVEDDSRTNCGICDIPKEFQETDQKSQNDDILTDIDNTDSNTLSDNDLQKPEQNIEESDNDFEKIDKSEIPKSDEVENTSPEESQALESENSLQTLTTEESSQVEVSKPSDSENSKNEEENQLIQVQNDTSQESNTVTESESRQSENESSNLTDVDKSEADGNENLEKKVDANITDNETIEPQQ